MNQETKLAQQGHETTNPTTWMGILNVTPDSFSDGGKFLNLNDALRQALWLEACGAGIIDVGACSTRPGSEYPSQEEEWAKLFPVLKELRTQLKPITKISLDTSRASVCVNACELNLIDIINDVHSGEYDERYETRNENLMSEILNETRSSKNFLSTAQVAGYFNKEYVCMHMQGTPKTMQINPTYTNIISEVFCFLQTKIDALKKLNVSSIYADPGIGFGKNFFQNLALLSPEAFKNYKNLGVKIIIGLSRKSFLKKIHSSRLNEPEKIDDYWKQNSDLESKNWEKHCILLGANAIRTHTIKNN
jgi:dihydropteroate synthase